MRAVPSFRPHRAPPPPGLNGSPTRNARLKRAQTARRPGPPPPPAATNGESRASRLGRKQRASSASVSRLVSMVSVSSRARSPEATSPLSPSRAAVGDGGGTSPPGERGAAESLRRPWYPRGPRRANGGNKTYGSPRRPGGGKGERRRGEGGRSQNGDGPDARSLPSRDGDGLGAFPEASIPSRICSRHVSHPGSPLFGRPDV